MTNEARLYELRKIRESLPALASAARFPIARLCKVVSCGFSYREFETEKEAKAFLKAVTKRS
jgi:hypothetical protein